jgi:predicted transcriptional regulator of viral defense system
MDEKYQIIKKIAEQLNGVITTKQIEEAGLKRYVIKNYLEQDLLVKESHGIYALASASLDEYKLLQMRSDKMVFSYGTALYLHGMSDRIPHILDVTVPQGYNVSRIKKDNPDVRFHYVRPEYWKFGISTIRTPLGAKVVAYDKERCICDLINSKKHMDTQLYAQAIKDYFKNSPDVRKIIKYGKKFNVEGDIRTYIEVLL